MWVFSRRSTLVAAMAAALTLAGGAAVAAPAAQPGDMTLGSPQAPVKVVEYASLTCSHCATFNNDVFPAFKAKYIDTGRVHYTLKEFPTAPAQVAAAGFLMARCAGGDRYFKVVDEVFRSQPRWKGDIRAIFLEIAKANGMTDARFEACLSDEAAIKAFGERVERSEQDGVQATPTFYVNGKLAKEGVMSLSELDAAIAAAGR